MVSPSVRPWFGVPAVFVGAFLVVLGAVGWRRAGAPVEGSVVAATAIAVVAVLVASVLVRSSRPASPPQEAKTTAIRWLVAFPALVIAAIVDIAARLPVVLTAFAAGAVLLAGWWMRGRVSPLLPVLAVVLGLTGFAPVFGWVDRGPAAVMFVIGVIGLVLIAAGAVEAIGRRRASTTPQSMNG
jgi:hypothetical protein